MPAHEVKTCPRCKSRFECKAGSITICQCMEICLASEALESLRKYDDCLCKGCLQELRDYSYLPDKNNISE